MNDRYHSLIDQMHPERHPTSGMDIVIVVTSTKQQEKYWQKRLEEGKGRVLKPTAIVLVVCEDWPSGAGNGLGTLYAYQQACIKAQSQLEISIETLIQAGASAAMYHTSGMGTRLFPLVGAEHNNKAAVKLPEGKGTTTLLEAVIRQTAIYATGRKGRLSVFWGDQLFIPSELPPSHSEAHVDILTRLIPLPTEEEWRLQELSRYGLIADVDLPHPKLLEKLSYEKFAKLVSQQTIGKQSRVGVSLGSFSVSQTMLHALLKEFHDDLLGRKAKWDSDPHFWMPLTLTRDVYLANTSGDPLLGQYYDRMNAFKQQFAKDSTPLFKAVDVGSEGYWWDYGTVDSYFSNLTKLTGTSSESHSMRAFFNLETRLIDNQLTSIDLDAGSVVCSSTLHAGKIRNCVLVGVTAQSVDLQDCIIIDSCLSHMNAKSSLFYNVIDSHALTPPIHTVRADTFVSEGTQQFKMTTTLGRNGKDDWNTRLGENPLSYAQLYQINQKTDFLEAQQLAAKTRQKIEAKETMNDHNHL